MSKIKVLNKVVADQIAAGEVVERPSSVVKELVENAIDAGATHILLEVDGGGAGRIRVLDNGEGFAPDDIETAFLRHATSKISNIEDLNSVRSFGFRGEALASIASVAKVTVHTRVAGAVAGTRLKIEGGDILERREAASPVGTDFEVRELFYNVPARLKFLKKEATEASHCIEALVRMALIRPDVSFKVMSAGRKVRELVKVTDPTERVKALFSSEALAMTEGDENGVLVRAVLGAPEKARAGAGSLYTYVNGRYIRDRALLRAVTQAFGHTLAPGRYPVGFISVEIAPEAYDVNVHPQKTEVRFANPQAVFRAVSHVVGAMAASSPWARAMTTGATPRPVADSSNRSNSYTGTAVSVTAQSVKDFAAKYEETPAPRPAADDTSSSLPLPPTSTFMGGYPTPAAQQKWVHPMDLVKARAAQVFGTGAKDAPPAESVDESKIANQTTAQPIPKQTPVLPAMAKSDKDLEPFSSLRYVGQAKNMFLVMEDEEDLVIIDQHAAHERVTYEKLRAQLAKGAISSQRLLTPHMVDLGPAETQRIVEQKDELAKLGLEVEQAGADRIAVYGTPAEIDGAPERLLAEVVLALEKGREGTKGDMEDHAVATMACHSSIRAGRSMQEKEVTALLRQMDTVDFAGHCPHGRPVLARIPWSEIRRRVKRE
ncbi:MAG: DNA mismatch repair endonuclease MutL [Deltaproteobacteria bacterium]|nr:DNA mismatch repair endonuclease MutL [Deltaproteobacteria bacterium]MBN2671950.1 DNA mismatch repair endonuclease MutL [Deltaproteobacteria bacterium]